MDGVEFVPLAIVFVPLALAGAFGYGRLTSKVKNNSDDIVALFEQNCATRTTLSEILTCLGRIDERLKNLADTRNIQPR